MSTDLLPLGHEAGWKDSDGHKYVLCVLHKLAPHQNEEMEAGVIVGGLSLCHEHGDMAVGFLLGGYSIEAIMQMQADGVLEDFFTAVTENDDDKIAEIQSLLTPFNIPDLNTEGLPSDAGESPASTDPEED